MKSCNIETVKFGKIFVIRVGGKLSQGWCTVKLYTTIMANFHGGAQKILVNFTQCSFISVHACRRFNIAWRDVIRGGAILKMCGLRQGVDNYLQSRGHWLATDEPEHMFYHETEEDALASF